ncbi:hypothetical protein BV25DRAFT_1920610 [Artomyces pyxidatus]|uniref:Uncharacterized protein n=1 Tax=Artomyces pyxidatus TaxID=48021 RepID=A0ACB8SM66_9AGAM|nr:hypothetical protein BV25DRAFT_1920610 [Artomyces pyxidatus]
MMKSFALLTVFATVALAQSNPLIPTGISNGCSTFLESLNNDTSLAQCTQPLITASSQFGPSSNATGPPSAAAISSALNTICATSSSCPDTIIRTQLASFYAACQAELTSSPNSDVLRTYDVLYALTPLKQAVCSKDDSGKYCATSLSTGSNTTARIANVGGADLTKTLFTTVGGTVKRDAAQVALIPNVTTYRQNNLVFLFLQPSLPSSELCVSCTRNIVTAYTTWETTVPYAPGLTNSPLLGGQPDLYNAITSTCGASFLSGSVQAAGGGLSGGLLGAAPRSVDSQVALVGSFLGALAVGIVSAL